MQLPYLVACTGAKVWRAATWARAGRRLEAAGAKALRKQRRPNMCVCDIVILWCSVQSSMRYVHHQLTMQTEVLRTCDPDPKTARRKYGGPFAATLLFTSSFSQNFPSIELALLHLLQSTIKTATKTTHERKQQLQPWPPHAQSTLPCNTPPPPGQDQHS